MAQAGMNLLGRALVLIFSVGAVICPFFLFSGGQSPTATSDPKSYLPSAKDTGEWRQDGPPQEFKGDDLYLYIDGGAEIYREYGFEQVVVQDYRSPKGNTFSLEIFRMSSPEASYGMYTFKKSPRGKVMSIGAEGQMEDYYLNFWKGPFLVTLTGLDNDLKTIEGMALVARLVDKKIREKAERPGLVAVLPGEGLIRTSVRYFRGYLGFMNVYPSLGKEELGVKEGVKGDYGFGGSLFVLRYPSEQESRARFLTAQEAIEKKLKSEDSGLSVTPFLQFKDERGKLLSLLCFKNYVLICIEHPGSSRAPELFSAVKKSL